MLCDAKQLRSKTLLVAGVAVLSNVLGNYALSLGMRRLGPVSLSIPSLAGVFNFWVGTGICLLAVWMFSQLSLLSWADLSYVLPVTSSSYVLSAVVGAVALHESVSPVHWIGISLIFLGVIVVGQTAPRTAALAEVPG